MSLVKDVIESVAREGLITHEFPIKNLKFKLKALSSEEQFLADGMVDTNKIKKKYGAENLVTLNDQIQKHRSISMIALATVSVNGKCPVDEKATLEEQFKQRLEFKDELMTLNSGMIDAIIMEFNNLVKKERDFYKDIESNLEK